MEKPFVEALDLLNVSSGIFWDFWEAGLLSLARVLIANAS
jgi:hypothetical protein